MRPPSPAPKKEKKLLMFQLSEAVIDRQRGCYVTAALNAAALISIKASWWLIWIVIEDNQTATDLDAFNVSLRFS